MMMEDQGRLAALLAGASVLGLGCVFALCLCCRRRRRRRKRSAIQQEDNALYDQDVFDQRRDFSETKPTAGFRSKPTERETPPSSGHSLANGNSDNNWSYQNLPDASAAENGILEPTYVDPLPAELYVNEDKAAQHFFNGMPDSPDVDQDSGMGTYGNVFPTKVVQHDSADSSDYENSEMWIKPRMEESAYVNAQ